MLAGLLFLAGLLALLQPSLAASLQQVTGFTPNPTNTFMYIYVPDRRQTPAPILVAMHYCTGTAQAFYSGTGFARLADQYGFIVIYPQAPSGSPGPNCWDVATPATLRNEGGGDSLGIASQVRYTISRYQGDADRVYAMGHSSGGMMSNVLAGSYPNLFKAIAPSAGVPFACFAGSSWWSNQCANGQLIRTGQQWGDLVRAAYPGYTGPRPRMQIWHGTNDETINFNNFGEQIKEWTNVLGVSETPSSTEQNFYRQGWTRTKYGDQVEAIRGQGQPHNIEVVATEIIKFFGLDRNTTSPSTTARPTSSAVVPTSRPPTSAAPTSSAPVPTSSTSGPLVPRWGQCGGIGWTGGTQCVSGTTCTRVNDWYYQCL